MPPTASGYKNFALLLIAAGILCNPFVIGYIFSPSGSITALSWIVAIVVLEVGALIAGVRLWRSSSPPSLKRIFFILAMGALVFCTVEIGLHIIRWITHPYEFERTDRRASLPQYHDKSWAKELFRENNRVELAVVPYLGWRTAETHGTYLNVGADGVRATMTFPHEAGVQPDTDIIFGGSTVWGSFVRDERTISSCMAKLYHDRGRVVDVVNQGERGFIFMQNVLQLMLLLREGQRPERVVFYEGANEVVMPFHLGKAGVPGLQPELEDLLARRRLPLQKQMALSVRDFFEERMFIFRSFDRLMRMIAAAPASRGVMVATDRLGVLPGEIAADFRKSAAVIDSLSRQYGFQYTIVLQPLIYTRQHRAPEEEHLDPESEDSRLAKLTAETYAAINALKLPHFVDLSHIFDAVGDPIFSDFCHVSEEGNELVAAELVRILK